MFAFRNAYKFFKKGVLFAYENCANILDIPKL